MYKYLKFAKIIILSIRASSPKEAGWSQASIGRGLLSLILATVIFAPVPGLAAGTAVETMIVEIFVNGGSDTANPGTTCLKLSSPVSPQCTSGLVAIPNSNSKLLAAALTAKATRTNSWFYYDDAGVTQHCPGLVFTPCSVISISVK